MTFSDTAMMEFGITQSTNIHNTRSLIRTLKYVLDILQTEEAFTVEEYKHTHTHACDLEIHDHVWQNVFSGSRKLVLPTGFILCMLMKAGFFVFFS